MQPGNDPEDRRRQEGGAKGPVPPPPPTPDCLASNKKSCCQKRFEVVNDRFKLWFVGFTADLEDFFFFFSVFN